MSSMAAVSSPSPSPQARGRPGQGPRGGQPLLLERREGAGEHRLGEQRGGDAQLQGVGPGPLAGALLAGRVQDLVQQGRSFVVPEGQDVGGDGDQVGVQLPPVPAGEHLAHPPGLQAEQLAQQVVGLADELHVPVLDAVVHHLHVVARAVPADPLAAGRPVRRPAPRWPGRSPGSAARRPRSRRASGRGRGAPLPRRRRRRSRRTAARAPPARGRGGRSRRSGSCRRR